MRKMSKRLTVAKESLSKDDKHKRSWESFFPVTEKAWGSKSFLMKYLRISKLHTLCSWPTEHPLAQTAHTQIVKTNPPFHQMICLSYASWHFGGL